MAGYVSRPRDMIGGLSTVAVGSVSRWGDLEFGTARQMGPGYFPVVLSSVLIIPEPCASPSWRGGDRSKRAA